MVQQASCCGLVGVVPIRELISVSPGALCVGRGKGGGERRWLE